MKVCILGSGISSLTLAKALVNKKIKVDILFSNKFKNLNFSRTLGITKNNVEYFNKNIVKIDKLLWKLNKIEIYSDNLKNEKLLKFENNKNQLFSIIKNHELYKLLYLNLIKNKYFKKLNIYRDDLINDYDLVINTDFNHKLTKKYFSKKIIKKYKSIAYTTIIKHKKISNNTATQIFTKKGPLAFLPISNFETSIVYSFNDYKVKKNENILNLIKQYNFKYKIKSIKNFDFFELINLSLRSYHHGKILAFGDLLHKIHPLAGQGFNMTIRDIQVLLDIIINKRNLGLPLDYSIASEFQKNVRHKNFIFINGIDLIYEFFNFERNIKSRFVSKSIQKIGKNIFLNKLFRNLADKGISI